MPVLGLDVSHHSGRVDFNKAVSAGVRFTFIRASQGITADTRFVENWNNAQRAGLPCGAYHYLRGNINAIEQAQFFCSLFAPDDLPPVVDVEETVSEADVRTFLLFVEMRTDQRPIIYTSRSKWIGPLWWSSRYDLWVANYDVQTPALPDDWWEWVFWQYTDTAPGAEYGVLDNTADLNWFNGTQAELDYYIRRVADPTLPRVRLTTPERIKVIPPNATPAEASYIMLQALKEKASVTHSWDNARRGVVHLYKIPADQQQRFVNWYWRHYPKVERVEFHEIPPNAEGLS